MFALYRYHAVFTDSPLPLVQAEKTVGRTGAIEQARPTPTRAAARSLICRQGLPRKKDRKCKSRTYDEDPQLCRW